jgi:hypothetical protein
MTVRMKKNARPKQPGNLENFENANSTGTRSRAQ